MHNIVSISGRLVTEPKLKHTKSNIPVTSFILAVEQDPSPRGGSPRTDYIDCVAWYGKAEFVAENFSKGMLATVDGRLQVREWTGMNRIHHRSSEIVVLNVYFCGDCYGSISPAGEPPPGVG